MTLAEAQIMKILEREGGFIDHPADRGGPTKFGITQDTLGLWRGKPVSVQDVAEMQAPEAIAIYLARYVDPIKRLEFMPEVFALVLDISVMSGPSTAVRLLQTTVNKLKEAANTSNPIAVDGIVGPETVMAVVKLAPSRVVQAMVKNRLIALVRIVQRDSSQLVFLEGWLSRTLTFLPEVA